MLITGHVVWIFPVGMMVLGAGAVSGQDYPNKPIRIVTSGVGGGSDFTSRLIAPSLTSSLGQSVVVDNRPSGVIPGQVVSQAPPDGYTLLVGSNSLWVGSLLQQTPYDPVRDFLPITTTSRAPSILVVHPSLPVKSVKELIAFAKARPGELNYSASAVGSSSHLGGELFKSMTGTNIVRITYKSNAQGTIDLIAGNVQLSFLSGAAGMVHVKSGKLRALAVTSIEPSALAPGLLPMADLGVPGYELVGVDGIFAPAKTPTTIINRLNQEIVRVLNTAEAKERYLSIGAESVGSSPEKFAATIKSEMATVGKLIKDAGIRLE